MAIESKPVERERWDDPAQAEADVGPGAIDTSLRLGDDELPLDLTFELLQNGRRRAVLRFLADQSATTTLGTLAEHLAAAENDKSVDELSSTERKRVYISLYQCHLPKLDDAEVVDYDRDRGTVERSDAAACLDPYLELDTERDDATWSRYRLGFTLIGGGVISALFVLSQSLLAILVATTALVAVATTSALVLPRWRSEPDPVSR